MPNSYPSHQEQWDLYQNWKAYLVNFPFEWHATFTFSPRTDFFYGIKRFKRWRLSLINEEKLQIAASLTSSSKGGQLHFHVLLLGQNKEGKTLLDVSPRKWESRWHPLFCRISLIENLETATDYVARHHLGFKSDFCQADAFGVNLLEKRCFNREEMMYGYHTQ